MVVEGILEKRQESAQDGNARERMGTLAKMKALCQLSAGFNLGILASLIICLGMIFYVLSEEFGVNAPLGLTLRGLFGFLSAGCISWAKKRPLLLPKHKYLWCAALCHCGSNSFVCIALKGIDYGDAIAIFFSYPILVGVVGYFFLKERFTILDALLTVVILLGVLFVVQPSFIIKLFGVNKHTDRNLQLNNTNATFWPSSTNATFWTSSTSAIFLQNSTPAPSFDDQNSTNLKTAPAANATTGSLLDNMSREIGAVLALLGAVFGAGLILSLRKCPDVYVTTSISQLDISLFVTGIIMTSAMNLWNFPTKPEPWLYLSGYILIMPLYCFVLFQAVRREKASLVSVARVSEVPMSYIFQLIILGTSTNIMAAIGATVISVCVALISLKRYLKENKKMERREECVEEDGDGEIVIELIDMGKGN